MKKYTITNATPTVAATRRSAKLALFASGGGVSVGITAWLFGVS